MTEIDAAEFQTDYDEEVNEYSDALDEAIDSLHLLEEQAAEARDWLESLRGNSWKADRPPAERPTEGQLATNVAAVKWSASCVNRNLQALSHWAVLADEE
jgi:hypothetical protein